MPEGRCSLEAADFNYLIKSPAEAGLNHPGFNACEQSAEVAADFTEGGLRAVSAGDALGEPGLLDCSRSPYPHHQGADRIQMAPIGVTLGEWRWYLMLTQFSLRFFRILTAAVQVLRRRARRG